MRLLSLTDDEVLLLDGKASAKVQEAVDQIKRSRQYVDIGHPHLMSIIENAVRNGRFQAHHSDSLTECPLCGVRMVYAKYKSGPNKGRDNYKKPLYVRGIDFNLRDIPHRGFCLNCKASVETLKQYILDHDLPVELVGDPATRYVREGQRRCFDCEQTMWEFDMGTWDVILGPGLYPADCPHCKARSMAFGRSHPPTGEWRVVTVNTLVRKMNLWVRDENNREKVLEMWPKV